LSWLIGIGTLRFSPDVCTDTQAANIELFDVDGTSPVVIVPGLGARSLTLEGLIFVDNSTDVAGVEGSYLTKFRNQVGSTVSVLSPGAQYDGTWVCASFEPKRQAEGPHLKYYYTMRLIKGGSALIL
jgi:hypothetical protein